MKHEERRQRLLRELNFLLASSEGYLQEVTIAQANHENLQRLRHQIEELQDLVEDPDFDQDVQNDLDRINQELSEYEREKTLFRDPADVVEDFFNLPNQIPYLDHPIVWRIGDLDLSHPKDWTQEVTAEVLQSLIGRLKSLEKYKWKDLSKLSKSNHAWEDFSKWEKASRERLAELRLNDQSGWYQIQLNNRGRLYGFRTGYVFNIVWWDRDHEVYKTKKTKASQR